jgi:hypothetical protein
LAPQAPDGYLSSRKSRHLPGTRAAGRQTAADFRQLTGPGVRGMKMAALCRDAATPRVMVPTYVEPTEVPASQKRGAAHSGVANRLRTWQEGDVTAPAARVS